MVTVSKTSTTSTDSQPDYFNEHSDPVYAHMVNVKEMNHKNYLIQFPISVDLEKIGTDQMSTKYFHLFPNGTRARTACFHERSAWKCMENWYNQSTSQGT